jgi:hypothetical protein
MANTKEFRNFTRLTDRLLAVSREAINKRIEQHREQSAKNPNKRGPKPKTTGVSTSGREDA